MFAFNNLGGRRTADVEVAHDSLALAVHESFVEIEEVNGVLPVAMSNVYEMWAMDDTRDMDEKKAVMEGVIGDAGKKIREIFKKLAAKIKGWWASVVKYFRTFFASNKKFIEKFGEALKTKDADDFEYTGHKWDYSKATEQTKTATDAAEGFNITLTDQSELKASDELKNIDTSMKAKSPQDFCDNMRKAAGATKTDTIKNLNSAKITEMINVITGETATIEGLEEQAASLSSKLEDIGEDYERQFEEAKDDSKKLANLRVVLKATKYQYSYATQALSACKEIASSMVKEYSSALRSFARHTPKSEKEAKKRVNESAGLLSVWGGEF